MDKEYQLFLAGQLLGMMSNWNASPEEMKKVVVQIDPDILQKFLDTKPEGFLYSEEVAKVIRVAKTLKSFSKGIKPSLPPDQGQ